MPCTTILVGRKASNDGSTMIARTDDGHFDVKKMVVVEPKKQPKKYKSVISHLEIELPKNPMRYTACPSVSKEKGIWAATGINAANVGMTATETTTSNPRVLAADPLVEYQKARGNKKAVPGGIGEEDIVVLVLPYIKSAREGVERLASLIEKYGTYESNAIAFNDEKEVWWIETIGGHHWIARRVPDDMCVIAPNRFGLDHFDFKDAYGAKKEFMCSADLKDFIKKYHLDLNKEGEGFNPRYAFGSCSDSDHVYNTPRSWFMGRCLAPNTYKWDGPDADFTPESNDIPWAIVPEKKLTAEDVKYVLSTHFQGTPFNPYLSQDTGVRGRYRSIGINRTGVTSICQIRPDVPKEIRGIEWICFASNAFNAAFPLYANVPSIPKYISDVGMEASTENLYWSNRLIESLADANYSDCIQHIERYQEAVATEGRRIINEYDEKMAKKGDYSLTAKANAEIADMVKKKTTETLTNVLAAAGANMKNGYKRSDN